MLKILTRVGGFFDSGWKAKETCDDVLVLLIKRRGFGKCWGHEEFSAEL